MKISLSDLSARAPKEFDKSAVKEKMAALLRELDVLQNLLYADGTHALLVVLQGMDASGKDGVIKNVFTAVNPLGIRITPYKAPTAEELSHDFLWRIHAHTPPRGMIQVFNRSHYEDVLITRVHKWIDDDTAYKRMAAINDFEKLLAQHNNTHILKFYLHISPGEQQERLQERLSDPAKQWKYNENDFAEAKLWNDYMKVYEECFDKCSDVPWNIIPADQNWYKEYLVASAIVETLKSLNLKFPGLKK